jgi:hypothetical protein
MRTLQTDVDENAAGRGGDHHATDRAARLLKLHRTAGNAAVARLARPGRAAALAAALRSRGVGNAAVGRALQRYLAGEHAKWGDHAPGSMTVNLETSVGKLQITSGELNALADLYASPEDLMKADWRELAELLKLVRREAAGRKVEEYEWDEKSGGRYTKLNLRNSPHFSPRNTSIINPPGQASTGPPSQASTGPPSQASTGPPSQASTGPDNRSMFLRYYNETIENAQSAYHQIGVFSEEYKQRCLDRAAVSAAFAEHFIMDAFSAGHLFNKDDFIAVVTSRFDALLDSERGHLFDQVAGQVLADPAAKKTLAGYEPSDSGWGFDWGSWGFIGVRPNFNHQYAFKKLLEHLYSDPDGRQAVFSALAKLVHDELSQRDAGGGLFGVEVVNDFDKKGWVLSGDTTLASSPKTQAMIDRALDQFRKLMLPYREGPVSGPGGYAPGSEKVLAYFPGPTTGTIKLIHDRVDEITKPKGAAPALVKVIKAQLESLLHGLVAHGDIRQA